MGDRIILVDVLDREVGSAEKLEAHRQPLLHRAFSIFLLDREEGRMLLQRRAEGKYHSGGLWANSCCSHPRVGEELLPAARRRLREELGVALAGPLEEWGAFVYYHQFAADLYEYEYDHVLVGDYRGDVKPDPEEIGAAEWVAFSRLERELVSEPRKFAPWFRTAAPLVLRGLRERAGTAQSQ